VITRFGLAPRLPGLTVARFQTHWRERHGPIIGALPGLRRYWQNHAVASSPAASASSAAATRDRFDRRAARSMIDVRNSRSLSSTRPMRNPPSSLASGRE